MPDTITRIGEEAFYECKNLLSVNIPSSVTTIGRGAFSLCSSITYIRIPENVIDVSEDAFSACFELQFVDVASRNKSYTSIGGILYDADMTTILCYPGHKADSSFAVPSTITRIGNSAFFASRLSTIILPKSLKEIGDYAFSSCSLLTNIEFPDTLVSLGSGAFGGCRALKSVNWGKGITRIKMSTFSACTGLEVFEVPEGVTSIGRSAFCYCTKLRSIKISKSVTAMGDSVFDNCTSHKTISGFTDSYAEKYASEFKYSFVSLGQNENQGSTGLYSAFEKTREYNNGMLSDINNNDWFSSYVKTAYEINIIDGTGNGIFQPNSSITLAEVLKIACITKSVFQGYDGGFTQKTTPWYQVYLKYAVTYGIVTTGEFTNWDAPATRAQMSYIFTRAVPDNQFTTINAVKTLPDVNENDKYGAEIFKLYRAGILTGNDSKGTFNPNSRITRAEAIAIVSRIIDSSQRIKTNN